MDCTVGKLISLKLCLFACKIRWFEHSLIRATIFNILYAKISQNWYNKLSCVNERVHSWLMWPVNLSHRECNVVICRFYTTATRCCFKWDVARPLVDAFFIPYSVCPKGTSEWIFHLCNKSSNSWILMTGKTVEHSVLICPNTALLFFISIQFKCCKVKSDSWPYSGVNIWKTSKWLYNANHLVSYTLQKLWYSIICWAQTAWFEKKLWPGFTNRV